MLTTTSVGPAPNGAVRVKPGVVPLRHRYDQRIT